MSVSSGSTRLSLILILLLLLLVIIGIYSSNNHFRTKKVRERNITVVGGLSDHSVFLKPGSIKRISYIVYSGGYSGDIRFKIYRVSKVGATYKIPTPTGLNVTISPLEAKLGAHKKYTFNITIEADMNQTGTYVFLVRAYVNSKVLDDWLRVLVAKNPNPSFASLNLPRVRHIDSITLKAGESAEINYTLYTGESSPGIVKLKIYRVKEVYETKEIPMPKGLNISVIPSERLVRPYSSYIFKIKIHTSQSLTHGKYVFCITIAGTIGEERSWLTINVR